MNKVSLEPVTGSIQIGMSKGNNGIRMIVKSNEKKRRTHFSLKINGKVNI